MTLDPELEAQIAALSPYEAVLLDWKMRWRAKARRKQLPPDDFSWRTYGVRAGRGFGKTETGSEWIGIEAASEPKSYNHVVAPTFDDVKETCFDGISGLNAVIPPALIKHRDKGLPSITLLNGAFIRGFAAASPERLRGPQCHRGWLDEIATWQKPKLAWNNYRFGLRLGKHPQTMWTSTLRPTAFVRGLLKLPHSIIVSGSSYENRANLAEDFFEEIQQYEGTAIGKQEIHGELLDPSDSGFVKRSQWKRWPAHKPLPRFVLIVMSLDTAFTEKTFDKKEQTGDPTACSTWGVFEWEGQIHVMLLDAWEDYLGLPKLISRIKLERKNAYGAPDAVMAGSSPLYGQPKFGKHKGTGRMCDVILIEEKGSGISLRQTLAAEEIMTEGYNPGKADKLARLHTISPMVAAGRVWAVESDQRPGEFRSWAEPLILQVCTYVGAGSIEHDDLLDSCVGAETLIVTSRGLRRINELAVGELVLTHRGRWQPITAVMSRTTDHHYRLKAKALDEIRITGNHPVWATAVKYRNAAHRYGLEPTFKRVDALKVRHSGMTRDGRRTVQASKHDAVMLPTLCPQSYPAYIDLAEWSSGMEIEDTRIRQGHGRSKWIRRFLPLNEDTGFLFGLFLAEGCVLKSGAATWSCDRETLERCARIMEKHLGIGVPAIAKGTACWRLTLTRKPLQKLLESFGHTAHNKLVPEWALATAPDFMRGFVEGVAKGDGHINVKTGGCLITSTSKSALWGLRLMLIKLGVTSGISLSKAAGTRRIFGRACVCADAWALTYQTRPTYKGVAVWRPEGVGYFIEYCERVDEPTEVWNLSVAEDESYVTTGGTVHNCTQVLKYVADRFMGAFTKPPKTKEQLVQEAIADRASPLVNAYG